MTVNLPEHIQTIRTVSKFLAESTMEYCFAQQSDTRTTVFYLHNSSSYFSCNFIWFKHIISFGVPLAIGFVIRALMIYLRAKAEGEVV